MSFAIEGGINTKILLCMYDVYAGGAETQFRYLAEFLSNNPDVELTCLFEKLDLKKESRSINFLEQHKIKYFNLNIEPLSSKQGELFLKLHMGKFRRYLIEKKVDMFLKVQPHFDWVITYNYTFLPHTESFHRRGTKILFSERNDASVIKNSQDYQGYVKLCDVVTCNSKYSQKQINKYCGINPIYIHNGIHIRPECFRINDCRRQKNIEVIVSARISPEKNLDILLKALILDRNLPIKIHVCGKVASENYYNKLLTRINEEKLEENIIFEGFQSNMLDWYHKSAFVILPSFQEGTPNAILEAYAYGIPAIASKIEPNSVLFNDEKLLFDPNKAEELVEAIYYICNLSDEAFVDLIQKNYELVCREYGIQKMCFSYLNLLN